MNKAPHSQESKVLDSEADPPTVMGPLSFAPELRTFQALPSHCTFPRHSLLHHTNAQRTGRANDGANHRGQGHILQGEGLILSFDSGYLIHMLQGHQACHFLPWEEEQVDLQVSLLPSRAPRILGAHPDTYLSAGPPSQSQQLLSGSRKQWVVQF